MFFSSLFHSPKKLHQFLLMAFGLWLLCFALIPISTTAAHTCAWLGAFTALSWRIFYSKNNLPVFGVDPLIRFWLLSCFIAFGMLWFSAIFWGDRWLYAMRIGRVIPSALAVCWLSSFWFVSNRIKEKFWHAVAVACCIALFETLKNGRNTPTNAIPWAVAMGFVLALLIPLVLDVAYTRWKRVLWLIACLFGLTAVLLSLSRGAWGIIPWTLFVWLVVSWRHFALDRQWVRWLIPAALLVASVAFYNSNLVEKPIERIQEAALEIREGLNDPYSPTSIDTSIGSRLYLWRIGLHTINESPWLGVGIRSLHRTLQTEAERLNSFTLLYAGDQLHNEWLQATASYGLWGLSALLIFPIALLWMARRLGLRGDKTAQWQLCGIVFMHITGGLTNVNFSQNYYGLVLGLSVALVLLNCKPWMKSQLPDLPIKNVDQHQQKAPKKLKRKSRQSHQYHQPRKNR